ncbi:hypothetical protein CsSME_00013031 [Camellia sinensis var. sinensis]
MNETQIRKPLKQQSVARGVLLKNSVNSLMEEKLSEIREHEKLSEKREREELKHVLLIVGFGYDEKYEKSQ